MSRRLLLLPLLGLVAACDRGPSLPDVDLAIRVTAGTTEVALGRAFPLTVVRTWSKDLVPSAWDDRALQPLVVRLEDTTRREDAKHVEETRRYRGYAFTRADVTVPGAKFRGRPRDGGADRSATSEPLRLRVRPALDPASPGAPELPGEPLPEAGPSAIVWAGLLAALAALAVVGMRARRRPRAATAPTNPPPPGPATVPAHVRALAALGAIRARRSASADEVRADVIDGADVVRAYLAERLAFATAERTTEELLRAPQTERGLDGPSRSALADLLGRSDRVKFAALRPTAEEGGAFLSLAESFVRGSAPDRGAEGGSA